LIFYIITLGGEFLLSFFLTLENQQKSKPCQRTYTVGYKSRYYDIDNAAPAAFVTSVTKIQIANFGRRSG
jgi:hypothetical protein